MHTTDGGASWRSTPIPDVGDFTSKGGFYVLGSYVWSVSAPKDGPFTVTRVGADGAVLSGHIPRPPYSSVSVSFASASVGWAAILKTNGAGAAGRSDILSTHGATWSAVASDAPVTGDLHLTGTHGWALGSTLEETNDGGRSWRKIGAPAPFDTGLPGGYGDLSVFGRHEVLVADVLTGLRGHEEFVVSDDAERTWALRDPPDDHANNGPALSVAAIDAEHWIAGHQTSLWTTDDAGRHWKLLTDHAGPGSIEFLSFADALHGWAVATPSCGTIACSNDDRSGPTLYATDDGGIRWTAVPLPRT